jgi:hypothetical protein
MDSIDLLTRFEFLEDGLVIEKSNLTTDQEKELVVPDDAHTKDWETLDRQAVRIKGNSIDMDFSYWAAYQVFAYNSAKYKQIIRLGSNLEPIRSRKQALKLGAIQIKTVLKKSNGEDKEYTDEENIDKMYYDEYLSGEAISGDDELNSFEQAYYNELPDEAPESDENNRGDNYFEVVFDAVKNESDFYELYEFLKDSLTGNRPRQKSIRTKLEAGKESSENLIQNGKWFGTYPLYKWKKTWETTEKNCLIAYIKSRLGGSWNWIRDFQDHWITKNKNELLGGNEVRFQREDLIKAMNNSRLTGPQYASFLLRMHNYSIDNISKKLFTSEEEVESLLLSVKKPIVKEFCLSRIRQYAPEKENVLDEFKDHIRQIEDALEIEILKLDERVKYEQR